MRNLKIKDVGQHLMSHDIKPSFQRIKIFEYLIKKRNHPTVDTIYKALSPSIPTLSKTTVYNTLKVFVDKKIADVVIIEENETRYDADTSIHGHFKCQKCQKVIDLEIQDSLINLPALASHQVSHHHYYFKGTCKECL